MTIQIYKHARSMYYEFKKLSEDTDIDQLCEYSFDFIELHIVREALALYANELEHEAYKLMDMEALMNLRKTTIKEGT